MLSGWSDYNPQRNCIWWKSAHRDANTACWL